MLQSWYLPGLQFQRLSESEDSAKMPGFLTTDIITALFEAATSWCNLLSHSNRQGIHTPTLPSCLCGSGKRASPSLGTFHHLWERPFSSPRSQSVPHKPAPPPRSRLTRGLLLSHHTCPHGSFKSRNPGDRRHAALVH